MAAYPNFRQLLGTRLTPDAGIRLNRAVSGKPRLRTRYSQVWNEGIIIHELNQADLDTLNAFYETNKNIAFTFVYAADLQTHTLQFTTCPSPVPKAGGFYDVTVTVAQV